MTADAQAIERYRYLLRTAPPEAIEQAHAEAFEQLTPEQRTQVLRELSTELPEAERAGSADPRALARMATRAEMRRPGTLERAFGGGGMGGGLGGMFAGSLLSSIAGTFIGTAIAHQFLGGFHDHGGFRDDAVSDSDVADASDDFGGDASGDFGDFGDI